MPVLSTSEIVAGYTTANVLRGVSIHVDRGEIVAVVGRNGVGKTTLMRSLIGLLPLREGHITFNDIDISAESADKRARRGIAYAPQGRGIFPQLTVQENLRMGSFINDAQPKPNYDMVLGYFPFLKDRLRQRGGTLSGGQQAMLSIARALVCEPEVLLLDEPSDGVQPSIVEEIGEFLVDLSRTRSVSVLLVEQNIGLMQAVAHRAYAMDKGLVTSELSGDDLKDEIILASHVVI
jgi:branched-chain amino acid transport system ATP-binding protein